MALFEQFPYTNFHEMNLDWALQVAESAKEHLDGYDEDMATIAQNALDTESWKNAAAGSATAAAASALAASGSADAAALSAADKTNVYEAEAWAKGTKNGVAVPNTDPQYHNNSKYWSDASSGFADDASGYSSDALDYSREAEAWADGEKDGTPVDVSAPQYENNAKYWSEQAYAEAQAGAAAGVSPYMPYSIGTCYWVNVAYVNVLAARTITHRDGTTTAVNIPGLIVFRAPIDAENTDTAAINDITSHANFYNIISGYGIESGGAYRIIIPHHVYDAVEISGGVEYPLVAGRVFNLTTGTWETDGSIGNIRCFITNAQYDNIISANNNAAIGDAE